MKRRYFPPEKPRRYIPRSRTADPSTSHAAGEPYEDQVVRPNTIRHKLLRLYDAASDGLVGTELPDGWWKRVSELRRLKLIKNTLVKRTPQGKKEGYVHIITDTGRRALARLDAGKSWPPTV